jgi:hypothetical protein
VQTSNDVYPSILTSGGLILLMWATAAPAAAHRLHFKTPGIPMSTVIDSCRDTGPAASSRKPSQSSPNQLEVKRESTKNQPF